MMCGNCKDFLVQLYVFSENMNKNSRNFIENENLSFCKEFLRKEDSENIDCEIFDGCLVLIPQSKNKNNSSWRTLDSLENMESENYDYEELETTELDYHMDEDIVEPKIEVLNDEVVIDDSQDYEIKVIDDVNLTDDTLKQVGYLCKKCNYEFESQTEFNEHMSFSHPIKVQGKFFCSRCSYQFSTHAHFTSHNNGHKLFDTLAQYMNYPKCDDCKIMFVDHESYEIHLLNHDDIRPIEKTGFFLKYGVRKDCDEEHIEILSEDSTKCGHCLKIFSNDEEVKKHLLVFHAVQLTCPVDLRTFNNNQSFTIHMRNNHPDYFPNSSHVCSVCKNEFETLYEKLSHMKICQEKIFQCNHCDKKFSKKCHLNKHLKQVSGELNIICGICNKVCRDKHDYKIHSLSHSNERPFKCSLCEKSYKTASARAAHLQSHLEIILCPFCELQFKSRRTMQKHVKLKHGKVQEI